MHKAVPRGSQPTLKRASALFGLRQRRGAGWLSYPGETAVLVLLPGGTTEDLLAQNLASTCGEEPRTRDSVDALVAVSCPLQHGGSAARRYYRLDLG
jgi:hypothetical protein